MKKVRRSLSRYKLVWVILLCAMALLFLSAATTHAAPQNSCGGYHFVQRGETLYSISRQYGVTVPALMRANPAIRNPNRIYAGTWLYIPCGSGGPGTGGPCRYVHYVQWGQTLGEIALHYHVSPYAIAQVNGISNPDLIYAGESLCIP
jgi:LysM repeat protein